MEFQDRARAWLQQHARPRGAPGSRASLAESKEFMATLHDAGLVGISWPVEYGGQGLGPDDERAFRELARDYDLPIGVFGIGLGMCGPTMLSLGTEEQKQAHIRPLLRGEKIWCQMFSEPGAGSDVASLQTRAVGDGDDWVLTGQKVWTTGAQYSDMGIVIARTDVEVPKHKGITMFIIDMHSPGVTVRPLRDMSGDAHFNEIFFDGVRIPAANVVGEVGSGWRAAITMLLHERVSIGTGAAGTTSSAGFAALKDEAVRRGLTADPLVRDALVDLYIRERAFDLLTARISQEVKAGIDPGARGSVVKLLIADLHLVSADTATNILGIETVAHEEGEGALAATLASAPGLSLGGGTNEIVRNTIGDYVLGLPKEPSVDRDIPFKDLRIGTQRKESSR